MEFDTKLKIKLLELHTTEHCQTNKGQHIGFLDDLFVDEHFRGQK